MAKLSIEYHSSLNPGAWDEDGNLYPRIQQKLIEIAEAFIGYLNVPGFAVDDIVLTGSMANYNWTEHSDFDLHVVTDYSKLRCDDIAEEFYRAKKLLWNDRHDITINGHDVELYVEDVANPPVSQGVYSVLEQSWINQPDFDPPEIDGPAVMAKVNHLSKCIKHCLRHTDDADDIEKLMTKISKMRKAGLADAGEFSTENLAFKVLRNQGLLGKLYKEHTSRQDRALSLHEVKMSPNRLVQHLESDPHYALIGMELEVVFPELDQYDREDIFDGYEILADDFESELGFYAHVGQYDPMSWAFDIDLSIRPTAGQGGGGVEIISPPMAVNDFIDRLPIIFNWIKGRGGYVNYTTGFHANLSFPGQSIDDIDPLKLALFLGDNKILRDFGRQANDFTAAFLTFVTKHFREDPWSLEQSMNNFKQGLDKAAKTVLTSAMPRIPAKYVSVNVKQDYIEFRQAGGSSYLDSSDFLIETVARYAYCMFLASDPTKERREYAKKLYKLLSAVDYSEYDDVIKMFCLYASRTVNKNQLKKYLRQLAKERKLLGTLG